MDFKEFIKTRYGKIITAISELGREQQLGLLPLKEAFTIVEGVNNGDAYAYARDVEFVTRLDEGCGHKARELNVPIVSGNWSPKKMRVSVSECYTTLESSMFQSLLHKGIDKLHIEDTDYALFLLEMIQKAIYTDFFRYTIFGDTEIEKQSSGGILRDALSVEDYNLMDGFLKIYQKDNANLLSLDANKEDTLLKQKKALTPEVAYNSVVELLSNTPHEVFAVGAEPTLLMTHSFASALNRYFISGTRNSESWLKTATGGFLAGEFEGVKVITHRTLDQLIQRDFTNGTKLNYAHFAAAYDKKAHQIGVDSLNSLKNIEVEYIGGEDERVYIKAAYSAEFKRVLNNSGKLLI